MEISGKISNSKSGVVIDEARIVVVSGQSELAALYSDSSGVFAYSDSVERIGETLVFRVIRDGFNDQEVVYHIQSDPISVDIELDPGDKAWEPKIPLLLGLESRRSVLIIGSIIYGVVLLVMTLFAAISTNIALVLVIIFMFILAPIYALVSSSLVKGFLVPIINGLTAAILFFIVVATVNESISDGFGPALIMLLGHLAVGGITTLIARALWGKKPAQ